MAAVSSPKRTVPVDAYVLNVLLRDLVGHDKQPAAFLVFLHLYGVSARQRWRPAAASLLRHIAEATGLSKSAVQVAVQTLRRRELIVMERSHSTATPRHRPLRRWAIDSKWS